MILFRSWNPAPIMVQVNRYDAPREYEENWNWRVRTYCVGGSALWESHQTHVRLGSWVLIIQWPRARAAVKR